MTGSFCWESMMAAPAMLSFMEYMDAGVDEQSVENPK